MAEEPPTNAELLRTNDLSCDTESCINSQFANSLIESKIKNYLEKNGCYYDIIPPHLILEVYKVFYNGQINDTITDAEYLRRVGIFYYLNTSDKCIKYYLMAYEAGDAQSSCNLGVYYENVEHNYEKAKTYYLMAIEKKCSPAMNNLGAYYYKIEKDFEKSKMYYLMAMENGNRNSMRNFINNFPNFHHKYMSELKAQLKFINPSTQLRQFMITHKDVRGTCLVCLETKQLYKYDCIVHCYCLKCLQNISNYKKLCPCCKFPEHPAHRDIFYIHNI